MCQVPCWMLGDQPGTVGSVPAFIEFRLKPTAMNTAMVV